MSNPYYDYNVATLKKYGSRYKITLCNTVRKKGYEQPDDVLKNPRGTNKNKLDNNISRAKSKIFEYAMCNPWEYFATLTLSPEKYDRVNLKAFQTDLSKYINNLNRYREEKIKYLIIPEKHKKSEGWHMHALFYGLNEKDLTRLHKSSSIFKDGKIPLYILNRIEKNIPIYTWDGYFQRFGYCVLDPIKSKEKISSYIMKYFTKDISRSVVKSNSRLFYSSHGLKKANDLYQGRIIMPELFITDYENEYVKIKWIDEKEKDLINDILDINLNDIVIENERVYNIKDYKFKSPRIKNAKLQQVIQNKIKYLQNIIDNRGN